MICNILGYAISLFASWCYVSKNTESTYYKKSSGHYIILNKAKIYGTCVKCYL